MQLTIKKSFLISALALFISFNNTAALAESDKDADIYYDLVASMPWAASISLNDLEFVDDGEIKSGTSSAVNVKQAIHFNHPLQKYFDAGFFIKGAYLSSDDTKRYWENKTQSSYGLEFVKDFSNDVVSWGQISVILGKSKDAHHDSAGESFDASLNEIRIQLTTTGDLLK